MLLAATANAYPDSHFHGDFTHFIHSSTNHRFQAKMQSNRNHLFPQATSQKHQNSFTNLPVKF